jgi:hypothetical protein
VPFVTDRARERAGAGDVADTPETRRRRIEMRQHHFLDRIAEIEIGVTNDPGADACCQSARTRLFRDAVGEDGLSHRAKMARSLRRVVRAELDIDRRLDPMTIAQVAEQIVE